MGKWRGVIKYLIGNQRHNKENAFRRGLDFLFPIFISVIAVVIGLYLYDIATGSDILQTILYFLAAYGLRWRTLIQIAPLVDQFAPSVLRLLGLGGVITTIACVGNLVMAKNWLGTQ